LRKHFSNSLHLSSLSQTVQSHETTANCVLYLILQDQQHKVEHFLLLQKRRDVLHAMVEKSLHRL
jgi:hypothetical protein